MSLSFEQLETAFRHRNFKPLYFLYGDETYLIDQAQKLLIEHSLAPHERDFNLDVIYGAEAEATQVLAQCASFPMMAERRVVIVRDFEKLKGNALFQHYAAAPNPQAIVLLACRTKPNLNAHPYRALKKDAAWAEFKRVRQHEVAGWVTDYLKTRGYRLTPDAAAMLADTVGTDLQTAASEADKLITYAAPRTTFTREDVLHAGGHSREFNVFELQKAVGDGAYGLSASIAEHLLQQSSNPNGEALRIVAILSVYFARLQKLAYCLQKRMPERAMASEVGVSPFFIKEYIVGARRYPQPRLDQAFAALLAADYELKGGSGRAASLIVLLLLRRLMPGRA